MRGRGSDLTTAILTGAVVLAWYIFLSAILYALVAARRTDNLVAVSEVQQTQKYQCIMTLFCGLEQQKGKRST